MWTPEQLERLHASDELEIAVDGAPQRWTPIWVVVVGDQVFVRTWHRRDTGWFGRALESRRARIRVPGTEADVTVQDVGDEFRAEIDAAYRSKYRRYGDGTVRRMVSGDAAAATLRLDAE